MGDAAFAQKCMDVFHERRDAGKTIVLVTHDMGTVQSLCDRAMLIHDGELHLHRRPRGDGPALLPAELRAAGASRSRRRDTPGAPRHSTRGRCTRGWSIPRGSRSRASSRATPLRARRRCSRPAGSWSQPSFLIHVMNDDSVVVFSLTRTLDERGHGAAAPRASACASPGGSTTRWCPGATRRLLGAARAPRAATWPSRACGCSTSSSYGQKPRGRRRSTWTPTSSVTSERGSGRERARRARAARGQRPVRARRRLAALLGAARR